MRKLLILSLLWSSTASGYAWALEPLPAPKPSGDAKASASTSDSKADSKKESSDSDTADDTKSKKHSKSKSKSKNSDKSDSSKDDEDKADDSKKDSDDGDSKKEEDSKPAIEPKIQGDVSMQGDSRIKMLLYDESDVYTITTRYGYQTNVVFSPQEEIELISVGDRSLWQIIPTGNRMFIRPMEEDVITNMTVITNKHSYQFDLKSLPADKAGNIYVAKFIYDNSKKAGPVIQNFLPANLVPPPVQAAGVASTLPASSPFGVGPSVPGQIPQASVPAGDVQPPVGQPVPPPPQPVAQTAFVPQPLPPQTQPQPLQQHPLAQSATATTPNYSYTYAGPDELAPLQVYDDGHATYLKYRDVRKLPPSAFVIDAAGKEIPVTYSVKGEYMVIDAVAGELALKGSDNTSVVHVFNEMLNPG